MRSAIKYFIDNKLIANLLTLVILVLGFIGFNSTNSTLIPSINPTYIQIQVPYPGGSKEEVRDNVINVLESSLSDISEINDFSSVSKENFGVINLRINRGESIDKVRDKIQVIVDKVILPDNIPKPFIIPEDNELNAIEFSITSDKLDFNKLTKEAYNVKQSLQKFNNIGKIEISGIPSKEIEISISSYNLRKYNITLDEIISRLKASFISKATGNIESNQEYYLIKSKNDNHSINDINDIIIKSNSYGKIIRVRDLATVKEKLNDDSTLNYLNNRRSIDFLIFTSEKQNIVKATESVNDFINNYNNQNKNFKLTVISNLGELIQSKLDFLLNSGLVGFVLVIFFLYLFLNIKFAIWVAMGIPMSILAMFIVMKPFDITINYYSIFGLIIVVGIIVDDAIVVGENILSHFHMGKSPNQAAIDGTVEALPAIIGSILTTIIAFSTFLFIDSDLGDVFADTSKVVILTLILSLIECIFLLPSHIVHFNSLKRVETKDEIKSNKISLLVQNKFEEFKDKIYQPLIRYCLEYKYFSIVFFLGLVIVTYAAFSSRIIKFNNFPSSDSNLVTIDVNLPPGTHKSLMMNELDDLEGNVMHLLKKMSKESNQNTPLYNNVRKIIEQNSSSSKIYIYLKNDNNRKLTSTEIARNLDNQISRIPGVDFYIDDHSQFGGFSPIQITFSGNDLVEIENIVENVKQSLNDIPYIDFVRDNNPYGKKEVSVKLNNIGYSLGFTNQVVMRQINDAFYGKQISSYIDNSQETSIWVRSELNDRQSVNDLNSLIINSEFGHQVPLSSIANLEIKRGKALINKKNGFNEITVFANIKNIEQHSTPDVLNLIEKTIISKVLEGHPSVSSNFYGAQEEADAVFQSLSYLIPLLLLVTFLLLVLVVKSYSLSIILMVLIPFSLIGLAWGHYIHSIPVTLSSGIGLMALIGILVNDGLVLILKFNENIANGLDTIESLVDSGTKRFRAIFLTSITTIVGLYPIILSNDRNSSELVPMAISIVYGLILSTTLTLFLLPLLILLFEDFKKAIKKILPKF